MFYDFITSSHDYNISFLQYGARPQFKNIFLEKPGQNVHLLSATC